MLTNVSLVRSYQLCEARTNRKNRKLNSQTKQNTHKRKGWHHIALNWFILSRYNSPKFIQLLQLLNGTEWCHNHWFRLTYSGLSNLLVGNKSENLKWAWWNNVLFCFSRKLYSTRKTNSDGVKKGKEKCKALL
jgi:hypothetical protein